MPNSLVEFSTEHPDDELRMLSSHHMEDELRVVVDAETPNSEDLCRTLDEAPEVHSYEVLRTNQDGMLLQLKAAEHAPRVAARTAGMLPQYLMILCGGWQTIETITSWKRLSQLKAEFKQADVAFEVHSVTQSVKMTDLLTDRQWEVLTEAITRGYYDSPRECSLTVLVDGLDVNSLAVSGVLHRAEEQIIKAFAADAKHVDGLVYKTNI